MANSTFILISLKLSRSRIRSYTSLYTMNGHIHLGSNYFALKVMQHSFDYQEGDKIFHGNLCRCKRVCGRRNNEEGDQVLITDNYV